MKKGGKLRRALYVILAIVGVLLIFNPFGGLQIRGEWKADYLRAEDGYREDYDGEDSWSIVFYDDGTGEIIADSERSSFTYSCVRYRLDIDGSTFEYKIFGNELTITDYEETVLVFHRK